jgi:hypothetical protein
MGGACSKYRGEKRRTQDLGGEIFRWFIPVVYVGKLEGKRPLGRPKGRGGDNIKMDLQNAH